MPFRKLIFLPIAFLVSFNSLAQNELIVLKDKWLEYTDAPNSLYHHLTEQACFMLKERGEMIAGWAAIRGCLLIWCCERERSFLNGCVL